MPSAYFPGWRDANAERAYPFEDNTLLLSNDNQLQLPDTWLVDAALFPLQGEAPFSIGRVIVEDTLATVVLVDANGIEVGRGECERNSILPIAVFDGDDIVATLVPGPDANHALFTAGAGDFAFGSGAASFVASTVLSLAQFNGFSGFSVGNETISAANLVLVGEYGVQLTVSEETEQQVGGRQATVTRVSVNAVGDPQFLARRCNDDSRRPLRFIREVVFQHNDYTHICTPNSLGNILMLAGSPSSSDTALQVRPTEGAIVIRLSGQAI